MNFGYRVLGFGKPVRVFNIAEIIVDINTEEFVLYDALVANGWNEIDPVSAIIRIENGINIFSNDDNIAAIDGRNLPASSTLYIDNLGSITTNESSISTGVILDLETTIDTRYGTIDAGSGYAVKFTNANNLFWVGGTESTNNVTGSIITLTPRTGTISLIESLDSPSGDGWVLTPITGTASITETADTGFGQDLEVFNITISSNQQEYDLETELDNLGWNGTNPVDVTVTINSGIYVWSDNNTIPAFDTGTLPTFSEVEIINNGFILGKGGNGGRFNTAAGNGGDAINTSVDITIDNQSGYIGGGGGGGGRGTRTFSTEEGLGIRAAGGGGGAGGGDSYDGSQLNTTISGGSIGNQGNEGNINFTSTGYPGGAIWVPGASGGRIIPGNSASAPSNNFANEAGNAGDAGASGGDFEAITAGDGGGAGNAGGDASGNGESGGGGGGWGASGGDGVTASGGTAGTGGTGGKAVDLNGNSIIWVNGTSSSDRAYGAVS